MPRPKGHSPFGVVLPMKIALSTAAPTDVDVDLLAVSVRAGQLEKDATLRKIDRLLDGALFRHGKDESFEGERRETLRIPTLGKLRARFVVVVGLGKDEPSPNDARIVAIRAALGARMRRTIAVVPPSDDAASVRNTAEGLLLGAYRYDAYLTGARKPKGRIVSASILVGKDDSERRRALAEGQIVAEAVCLARDLVNAPPNDLTPTALAEAARKACRGTSASCVIWNKKQIAAHKMDLLLAVSRGTAQEPRVVHMTYKPRGAKHCIAFVGKGLTFDSGGLCIKPAKSMIDMKCDMAGAAATIGILMAAARLKIPIEVHGFIGCVENMSGDHAYRPGDIFPSLDGKTVEIINTDAEGRLVLADVLAYAKTVKPDFMVDFATLTGACMVALGPWTAGLFANHDGLFKRFSEAAADVDESFWRLPLSDDLREALKSDVADLKHTGESHGGAITGALFLREFVGDTKWAHCDIAGPAFLERPHGNHPKGGTGFGVATALRFLEGLAKK